MWPQGLGEGLKPSEENNKIKGENQMSVVSMKQLLEAGVHFGHQTRRWNPKMGEYIYCERNGIYIIDLQKTVKKLEEAYEFVRQLSENGQSVLFVGTKKQATDAVKEEAIEIINNTIGKYDEKNIGKPLKEFFTEQNISISKVAQEHEQQDRRSQAQKRSSRCSVQTC